MIILLEIASETNTTLFIEIQEVFNIENKVGKKKSMEILTEVQKLRKTVSDLCKEVLDEQENKPKRAYSRDLPKMAVQHYGLKLQ